MPFVRSARHQAFAKLWLIRIMLFSISVDFFLTLYLSAQTPIDVTVLRLVFEVWMFYQLREHWGCIPPRVWAVLFLIRIAWILYWIKGQEDKGGYVVSST